MNSFFFLFHYFFKLHLIICTFSSSPVTLLFFFLGGQLRIKAKTIFVLWQTYYDIHPHTGSVFFPDLRDLYELLLRKEAEGSSAPMSAYYHQMERKGGRTPSLRLRFGRRADPLWHADAPADATSNWGTSHYKIFMIKYYRLLLAFNHLFIMDICLYM